MFEYFKSATHKYRWLTFKHYAGISALVIIFVVFIVLWFSAAFTEPKVPPTPEEVQTAIVNYGYEPLDLTEYYCNKDSGFKSTLLDCVAFEKDDIFFAYFNFYSHESAVSFRRNTYAKVRPIHGYPIDGYIHHIETDDRAKNYVLYSIDTNGRYDVMSYVGNTAVYARCDSENKIEINKILEAIDYLHMGNNREELGLETP